MKKPTRLIRLILLACLSSSYALAQGREIRIVRTASGDQAMAGQLVELFVTGILQRDLPPMPVERFQVLVTQDGETRNATVRMVTDMWVPANAEAVTQAGKETGVRELMATADHQTAVMFTVPPGLREGEANVVVVYRGSRSDAYKLTLINRLPAPELHWFSLTPPVAAGPPDAPDGNKEKGRRRMSLERGHDATFIVSPLFDPEVTDVTVQVMFKQGEARREVPARIIKHEAVEHSGGGITFGLRPYEVVVHTPSDLAVGPAEVEARLRVAGQVSEAGKAAVEITDASTGAPPRIIAADPLKVGVGQSVMLFVEDSRGLQPDPEQVVVLLEQQGKRVELKPEENGAREAGPGFLPVFLVVRVGEEVIGKATLRVFLPARGEAALSEAVPIEVFAEVLPPELMRVGESTKQEITQFKTVSAEMQKAGRPSPMYDPQYRYVTIQAKGLDRKPDHQRVVFEQAGKSYAVRLEDYVFALGNRYIVRLPVGIKPGEVTVTIQNRGAGRLSVPAIVTFEVAGPSRQ